MEKGSFTTDGCSMNICMYIITGFSPPPREPLWELCTKQCPPGTCFSSFSSSCLPFCPFSLPPFFPFTSICWVYYASCPGQPCDRSRTDKALTLLGASWDPLLSDSLCPSRIPHTAFRVFLLGHKPMGAVPSCSSREYSPLLLSPLDRGATCTTGKIAKIRGRNSGVHERTQCMDQRANTEAFHKFWSIFIHKCILFSLQ